MFSIPSWLGISSALGGTGSAASQSQLSQSQQNGVAMGQLAQGQQGLSSGAAMQQQAQNAYPQYYNVLNNGYLNPTHWGQQQQTNYTSPWYNTTYHTPYGTSALNKMLIAKDPFKDEIEYFQTPEKYEDWILEQAEKIRYKRHDKEFHSKLDRLLDE